MRAMETAGAIDRPAEVREESEGEVHTGRPVVRQPGLEEQGILEHQGEKRFTTVDCAGNAASGGPGDASRRNRQESLSVERGRLVTRYNKI